MARWTIRLTRPLSEVEAAEIEAIPGVSYKRGVSVPENALAIVRDQLTRYGIGFTPLAPHDPVRDAIKDARLARSVMRKEVPGYGVFPDFLLPWQPRGLAAILKMPNGSGMAIWSTGSGKTLLAIMWIACGVGRGIVVTKGAVKWQWAGEIRKFTTLTPTVLEGETPTPIPVDATIVLVNYDILPAWIEEIERWARGLQVKPSVVFDESQKVSSKKRWDVTVEVDEAAAQAAALDAVDSFFVDAAPPPVSPIPLPEPKVKFTLLENIAVAAMRLSHLAGRRLLTTATPMRDRVRNLWAQLDLAHPGEWGPYYGPRGKRKGWAFRYCNAVERTFGGMDDTGKSNLGELRARLLTVSHRVTKEEANANLPPARRIVTYIPIRDQVRATGSAAELRAVMKSGNPTAVKEMLLMEAAGRKRRWLKERVAIAVEQGLKTCIFTGRHRDCDELIEEVTRAHHGKAVIFGGHGGMDPRERVAVKDRYMAAPGPAILIGTGDAWGEGLDLQDTDLGICAMLPYEPAQVIQREGRWVRQGMKRPVMIEYPVCEGTYDERVSDILLTKLPALEKVIDQDEVRSFGRQLIGADDTALVATLADKILNGARRQKETEDAE